MKIRHIKREEYAAAQAVWDACFPEDADGFSTYYFQKRTCYKNVIAAFDGDVMAACLHVLPQQIWVSGKAQPVGFVAGVGTLPGYRMQGLSKELLRFAAQEGKERNDYAMMLKPVDPRYYTGFGFVSYVVKNRFEATGAFCPGAELIAPTVEALHRIYAAFAEQFDGMRLRSLADMELLVDEWNMVGARVCMSRRGYVVCAAEGDRLSEVEAAGDSLPILSDLAQKEGKVTFYAMDGGGAATVGSEIFTMIYHLASPEEKRPTWSLEYY